MKIDISLIISLISTFCVIVALIVNTRNNNKMDGITQGKISNDLEYIKRGNDTLALEFKDLLRAQQRTEKKMISVESDTAKAIEMADRAYKHASNAHVRIDKFKGGEK